MSRLPETNFIRNYVYYGALQNSAPLVYHLAMALSLVATSAPRDLVFRHYEAPTFPNFYALICGPTGDRKTMAVNVGKDILTAAAPALLGHDPTAEQTLVKMLETKPSQLFLYPELQTFLAKTAGAGNQLGAGLRAGFTQVYDGFSFSRQYANGKEHIVTDPRVSFVGACTPADLERYTTSGDIQGGFLNRFGYFRGEKERAVIVSTPWPEMRSWLCGYLIKSKDQMQAGEGTRLTPEALEMWSSWTQGMEAARKLRGEREGALLARTAVFAAKCSLLIAWSSGKGWNGEPWEMTTREIEVALALSDLHVRSGLDLLNRVAPNADMMEKRRVYAAIGADWTPLGVVTKNAELTLKKTKVYLETLLMEGVIATESQNAVAYYRQVEDGAPTAYNHAFQYAAPPSADPEVHLPPMEKQL